MTDNHRTRAMIDDALRAHHFELIRVATLHWSIVAGIIGLTTVFVVL